MLAAATVAVSKPATRGGPAEAELFESHEREAVTALITAVDHRAGPSDTPSDPGPRLGPHILKSAPYYTGYVPVHADRRRPRGQVDGDVRARGLAARR